MLYRMPPILFGNIPDRPPLLFGTPKPIRYKDSLNPIKLYSVQDFNKMIHSRIENPHSILTSEQVTRIIKHGPVSSLNNEDTTWDAQTVGDEQDYNFDLNLLTDAAWEDYSDTDTVAEDVEFDESKEEEIDEDAVATTQSEAVPPPTKTPRRRKAAGASAGASPVKVAKLKHATATADAQATMAPKKDRVDPQRASNNDYRNPDPKTIVETMGLTVETLPTTYHDFIKLSQILSLEHNFKIRSKATTSVENIRKHFIAKLFPS